MADPNNVSQYKYAAMSNLVLQADRRFVTRRTDEATGDPASLAGRINVRDMGSRFTVDHEAKPKAGQPDVERGDIREGADVLAREQRRHRQREPELTAADALVEGLRYRPRTPATQQVYRLILTETAAKLGDVPQEVVRSAADAVLEFLKDENMKDFDKKKEIDDLVGIQLTSKEFNQLVNLGKKITDYDAPDVDMEDGGAEGEDLDERQGVAVMFDNWEMEDGAQTNEVRDIEEDSDEDAVSDTESRAAEDLVSAGDDELLLQGDTAPAKDVGDPAANQISAREIDAFWLQRQIGSLYTDPHTQQEKTQEALKILGATTDEGEPTPLRDVENDLMELFDYEHHELVQLLISNRDKVVWVIRWRQSPENSDAQGALEREMTSKGFRHILNELYGEEDEENQRHKKRLKLDLMDVDIPKGKQENDVTGNSGGLQPKRLINLENLVFTQGNHLMTNPNVKLPQGSTKQTHKGYEEIHVPPPKAKKGPNDQADMSTEVLPEWARPVFGSGKLNRIQTRCFPTAFEEDFNMLVCAPTGSGKTNVAMLAMLREIGKHRHPDTGEIMLDAFKIVYIAPLKALVSEQVANFGRRLERFGIRVAELTGDRQLTKQQITDTQIIVTTPEKWDIITRKATDTSYVNLVRLICIDEIHLLHDDRGPVLESIVSRTIRKQDQTGDAVRIVGLSATLPNYRDVATFLRVDPEKGLFHFDGSYRPCPLRMEFVGITERKPIKQLKTMNDICYKKVLDQVGEKRQQMLIFVHSRKETAKTAKYIRDKCVDEGTIGKILRDDAASREVLQSEMETTQDKELKDIMTYGFGIHHAGMSRDDRATVEALFEAGHLQVLVCTATLAWGVNLPAHAVIIKGTQVYSPEKGGWVELSPQDVLQMLGRAGRPQYDTYGEGIIITTQAEIQYYLSLLNQQLPIESQFVSKLADNLNAEIVLGNVRTRDEAVNWLGYTYLFVRMLRSPGLYSVGTEYEDDLALEQKRVDLVHSAAIVLERSNLIKYDKKSGKLQPTELGRVASHYYITYTSMFIYNTHIQPNTTMIELFRVFALSEEFKYIPVRQDEKLELAKIMTRVPVPIKEGVDEAQAKINVLLQAYISRLKLEGLALMADLVYVTQSAGRLLRAIFEIALRKGWASVTNTALNICKMAERRMWPGMSPLRQFPACPRDIIAKAERIEVPWSSYFGLDPPRMGELLGMPSRGRQVVNFVKKFPRLEVQAQVQPMTRSLLRFELTITPDFEWDDEVHGAAESFWILVEDCDGEQILFHDQFLLRAIYAKSEMSEHLVEFTVPITEPMPPNYFIRLVSDRWMHAETKIAVPFDKLILPKKFPAHTQLLKLQPLPISSLKRQEFQDLYSDIPEFNGIQSQTFNSLFGSDDNVFIGAAPGSGKTFCAEFAILRHWSSDAGGKAVYVASTQEQIDERFNDWSKRFQSTALNKAVVKLTGDMNTDLKLLEQGELILATPEQWDVISRPWQRRKNVRAVKLFIADALQMIGGHNGFIYEICVSRMQQIALQTENGLRLIGLSVSLSNAQDIGEWLGATKHNIYNFSPHVRAVPLELHIQSFSIPHFPSLMLAMAKPTYQAVTQISPNKPSMIFVPNRRQVRATAQDLLAACVAEDQEDRFLHAEGEDFDKILARIEERTLAESISHGIGYYHEALSLVDRRVVSHLYDRGAIQVLVVSRDCCWEIQSDAYLVIVMGTQFFEGREHRYIDYPVAELLQMFGRARKSFGDKACKGVLMTSNVKREYFKKFLNEALPIESHLSGYLHDAFVSEISTKAISSTQDAVDWLTYTFFYRRLLANPSFYGMVSTSHEALSAYVSDLVENTLKDLTEANIIEMDEEDDTISPLNAAMIAAHYNISYITIQTFLLSLTGRTKLKGILEIVTSATEFESIQIRRHEDQILRLVYDRVPVKMQQPAYESPHFKAFVLLQAHFSRMQLPADLAKDQELIVSRALNLLSGCVDVLSSDGHLNALGAMEMSQMVVQGMWDRDSPLKQIPHFDNETVKAANTLGVKDVFEFMDHMFEKDTREALVKATGLAGKQLRDAADFTNNKYPSVELNYEVLDVDSIVAGEPAYIQVTVSREDEDEDDEAEDGKEGGAVEPDLTVHAPFYPSKKLENWWLVVGGKDNQLLGIKKVAVGRRLDVRLEFVPQKAGKQDLTLYLMCDSYIGVDQDPTFSVDVQEGEDDDEDEDENGDD